MQKTPVGWVYRGTSRPVELINLDNISDRAVQVLCNGELLETMDYPRALSEAHPGAVLLHQGETYLVKGLDLERNVALAAKDDVNYYTDVLKASEVGVLREQQSRNLVGFKLSLGELHVEERLLGYRVRRYDRTVGIKELDLPPVDFETVGLWLALPEGVKQKVEAEGWDWTGGLHGAEHALIAMASFHALCDRWDIGGVSTPFHRDVGRAAIFVYDGFPGGIGIAEKLFELFPQWLEATHQLVRDCPCAEGCPSCIYSPKCGNQNQPLDKRATLLILSETLAIRAGDDPRSR